ncbi:MAG: radical SAM protein [Bacteroidales bacterium]
MPTALFNSLIVGPIHSRRLGTSLGINLLPTHSKWCNFNCIYCECGWNEENPFQHQRLCNIEELHTQLELKLKELQKTQSLPEAITFSGNGEPTMHPQFEEMVDKVISLRNQYAPLARICVLTNATLLHKKTVIDALLKVDLAMLKLDAGIESSIQKINLPQQNFSLSTTIENMHLLGSKLVIQTMFLRGEIEGIKFDNTTGEELEQWINTITKLKPKEVMLYSIERNTPAKHLQSVNKTSLEQIAQKLQMLNIKASVYASS